MYKVLIYFLILNRKLSTNCRLYNSKYGKFGLEYTEKI